MDAKKVAERVLELNELDIEGDFFLVGRSGDGVFIDKIDVEQA